ncbi:DUF2508 family protein [Longirhabdus pacifica]|uniref:DUF2508 family protein n=1 Tax=Longirhabdus pacifica TaxID=2305227 RepID=UPI00100871CF|nr:DUF2508 family protein [Longirhabdus pacifica]
MNIFKRRVKSSISKIYNQSNYDAQVIEEINSARYKWQLACHNFNFVVHTKDIDKMIHHINDSEKEYVELLKRAKKSRNNDHAPFTEAL